MRTVNVDSREGPELINFLRDEGNIVALLGTGISVWAPTSVPTGYQMETIVKPLLDSKEYSKEDIANSLAGVFYPVQSNPLHTAFAQLLNEGVLAHVITTCFDNGLENAFATLDNAVRTPSVVALEEEASHLPPTSPIIFKVAGCASYERRKSIALDKDRATWLSDEWFPAWKRRLFTEIVEGKISLFAGTLVLIPTFLTHYGDQILSG